MKSQSVLTQVKSTLCRFTEDHFTNQHGVTFTNNVPGYKPGERFAAKYTVKMDPIFSHGNLNIFVELDTANRWYLPIEEITPHQLWDRLCKYGYAWNNTFSFDYRRTNQVAHNLDGGTKKWSDKQMNLCQMATLNEGKFYAMS